MASFMELFRCRGPPGAYADVLFCSELVSEFCLLYPYLPDESLDTSSPKNPCNFLENLPPMLPFDPWDDMVVALAIDGRLSSGSPGNPIPVCGAYPGDTWPRLSLESPKKPPNTELGICRPSCLLLAQDGMGFPAGACRLIAGVLVDPECIGNSVRCLSPTCSMGEGPASSQGAMSARELYGCELVGSLPGDTEGSVSSLCKQLSANVFGLVFMRACNAPFQTVSAAMRPAGCHRAEAGAYQHRHSPSPPAPQ